MKLRKFQISCPVFWGYNQYVDIDKFNNLDDIIKYFLDGCEEFFKFHNLLDLYEFFKSVKPWYHIHDVSYELMHNLPETTTIYICRHNNCNNPIDNLIINR